MPHLPLASWSDGIKPSRLRQRAVTTTGSIEIGRVDGQTFRNLGETDVDLALYSDNPVPPSLRSRDLFRERGWL